MKQRFLTLSAACLALLVFFAVSASSQTVLTFDDIPLNNGTVAYLPNNYQGLVWSNFVIANGILSPRNFFPAFPTNGEYYGVVSLSNVVAGGDVNPCEIDSPGTNFNFLSAHFTGDWMSNLNIEVQGFRGTTLVYDQTVFASATNPTLFAFNYLDVNRLYFTPSGGQPAFGGVIVETFIMDNFSFEFIPEPSTVLLTALGALTLCTLLRRRPGMSDAPP